MATTTQPQPRIVELVLKSIDPTNKTLVFERPGTKLTVRAARSHFSGKDAPALGSRIGLVELQGDQALRLSTDVDAGRNRTEHGSRAGRGTRSERLMTRWIAVVVPLAGACLVVGGWAIGSARAAREDLKTLQREVCLELMLAGASRELLELRLWSIHGLPPSGLSTPMSAEHEDAAREILGRIYTDPPYPYDRIVC